MTVNTQGGNEYFRVKLPNKNKGELFGVVDKLLGASHLVVLCADGKVRMTRIPGKIKRRMWIREGDLVIVRPWDFQDDKADAIYRYTRTQVAHLSRNKMLPEILDFFGKK